MTKALQISDSSLFRLHCVITFMEQYLKLQFKVFFFIIIISLNLLFIAQCVFSVPWFSHHISRLMLVDNNKSLK